MRKIDKKDFSIDYKIHTNPKPQELYEDYVILYPTEIEGYVTLENCNSDTNEIVGKVKALIVPLKEAIINNTDIEEMLESDYTYSEEFFDYRRNRIKKCFGVKIADLLIIQEVILNKNARGYGLGKDIITNLELLFGQNKLVIMKPYPIQWSGMEGVEVKNIPEKIINIAEYYSSETNKFVMDFQDLILPKNSNINTSNEFKTALNKLADTYKSIGYKKAGKTNVYYKHLF